MAGIPVNSQGQAHEACLYLRSTIKCKTMIRYLSFVLLLGILPFAATGQYYTVNVGTFVDASVEDFRSLRSQGFVYGASMEGNLHQVLIAGYQDRATAERVLQDVKKAGYSTAYIQERYPADGRSVTVIQLATLDARKLINWSKYTPVGSLYGISDGQQIKVVTGTYTNPAEARDDLDRIKQLGFNDAFIRQVNSIFLHPLGVFETGIAPQKKPLIPIELDETPPPVTSNNGPTTYGNPPANTGMTARSGNTSANANRSMAANSERPTVQVPNIRADVKRRSALDLQKVLKVNGTYSGSLDGLYGPGTTTAYREMVNQNRQLRKYQILGQEWELTSSAASGNVLQQAINDLPTDQSASSTLERYDDPIAKAYRAYNLFQILGPSSEVNALMNNALTEGFANVNMAGMPPFDPSATYSYQRIDQLIQHMYYLHAVPNLPYSAPCWLLERHPAETAQAQASFVQGGGLLRPNVQDCDPFTRWPEVRTLLAIASDLNGDAERNNTKWGQASSLRAQLYLSDEPLSSDMGKVVTSWNERLWQNMDSWAAEDPVHQRIVTALKVSFFQAQVMLEDYYMNQGFEANESKPLALATMRTLVGYQLERFTR